MKIARTPTRAEALTNSPGSGRVEDRGWSTIPATSLTDFVVAPSHRWDHHLDQTGLLVGVGVSGHDRGGRHGRDRDRLRHAGAGADRCPHRRASCPAA